MARIETSLGMGLVADPQEGRSESAGEIWVSSSTVMWTQPCRVRIVAAGKVDSSRCGGVADWIE